MRIAILNGPNLNLLGQRQPGIYGSESFENYLDTLRAYYPDVEFWYFQSNTEGTLIDKLHTWQAHCQGFVLNAGAFTHTSVALADAVSAIQKPVIEVHISNIYQREDFRKTSYLSPVAAGVVCGMGLDGYRLAVEYLLS